MSLYRIKQFYWSITSKIDENDNKYIEKYLNSEELKLFHKLSVVEQKHCLRVAHSLENLKDKKITNKERLIKTALLHDIGKIAKRVGIVDKSLLVIGDKVTGGKLRKHINIKKVDVYYNHGDKGYDILKKIGEDERILYLVKNHHNNDIIGDKELNLLKLCDSNN